LLIHAAICRTHNVLSASSHATVTLAEPTIRPTKAAERIHARLPAETKALIERAAATFYLKFGCVAVPCHKSRFAPPMATIAQIHL
jgi:hypothetical protein